MHDESWVQLMLCSDAKRRDDDLRHEFVEILGCPPGDPCYFEDETEGDLP